MSSTKDIKRIAISYGFIPAFVVALLTATFIMPVARAVAPVISTTWTISNGASSPVVHIDGVNYDPSNDKFDFTVDVGSTGLEYDSVAFVDDTHMRFNFKGIANTGTITIQAKVSAFSPVAAEPSNIISLVVPVPLLTQSINFTTPSTMKVKDPDQIPKATATSGLTVVLVSNKPSVCTIDFLKIHAVATGTCSITATQNGSSIYSPAISVEKTFTIIGMDPVTPGEPDPPVQVVTNLGVATYDPKNASTTYISVLFGDANSNPKNATLVKLLLQPGTTDAPVVFLISAISSEEETAAGYFVARINSTTFDGTHNSRLKKIIDINLPAGAPGSFPAWSFDGLTWYKLSALTDKALPADLHAGYFVEKDGRIAILSHYLMLFGFKKSQVPLKISTSALSMAHGSQVQILANGGSGAGAVTFNSRTLDVCTISESGVVTGVAVGKCIISARKASNGIYSNAISSTITSYVQHKSVGR